MPRRLTWYGGLLLGLGLALLAPPAWAVITRLMPLRDALAANEYICVAKVEKLLPEKPAAVLVVTEDLKGKFPFRRLPVNLTGDVSAQKDKETPRLLKRLAPDLPVVLFVNQNGKRVTIFAYTNGTWFMLRGQQGDSADKVVLGFMHFEPYLRRTFKGTTAEMRQAIVDGLSGKKQPPEVSPNEPAGIGPEVLPTGKEKQSRAAGFIPAGTSAPLLAVIPTLGLGGPLALLALLFPTLFGGVLLLFRRWLAFFTVFSLVSTIYMLHWWFAGQLLDTWWGTETVLWAAMTLSTLIGVLWAWRRHAKILAGEITLAEAPPRTELLVLGVLSLTCLGIVAFYLLYPPRGPDTTWDLLLIFSIGIWAGTLYRLLGALWPSASRLPSEGVMLWAAALGFTGFALARSGHTTLLADANAAGEGRPVARLAADRIWSVVFGDRGDGLVVSSPCVIGNRIYVAAAHQKGFENFGTVYCLHRGTQQVLWSFDNDGLMKQVFSSPCVADGRLFIGEGFHDDSNCKFYCLDATTGAKRWEFQTGSQTESSPCVADGKVFFGAGNDGVYALDAITGKEVWRFHGEGKAILRIGAGPAVDDKRLYVGSGVDRNRPEDPGETAVFCLNADTGAVIWKVPTNLPCWGAPAVADNAVYFGLGNGDILQDASTPSGALLCLDLTSGLQRWRFDVPNGVLNRPAFDRYRLYFGCRDGSCYSLNRRDGQLRWKHALGSPVLASPVLDDVSASGRADTLFAVGVAGQICCLDTYTGKVHWSYDDLQKHAAHLSSTPALLVRPTVGGERRLLFFGATLNNRKTPALYCLSDLLPEG